MTSRSVVRTGRLLRIPWKNGAGTTREVAVFPAGACPEDFRWRVSVADIDQDSSFSTFSGADRHFTIASPGSLQININGEERTATYGSPETFPGEAAVSVKSVSGPTSVINLITRRDFCTGHVGVGHLDGPLIPHVNTVALALLDGAAWTDDGEHLQPLDFLICGPGREEVQFKDALVVAISVFPQDSVGQHPGPSARPPSTHA